MLDPVLRQAQRDFEVHLERLQRYIRQPSVSADNHGIEETVQLIAREIAELGGSGRVVAAKEFPIVYGRFEVGAPRTVIVHSMYDTTPADEPNWSVPPFEARRVAQFENLGDCIVGRGAEDTKGPLTTVMNAVAAYRAAGVRLPCNLVMIYEASELGSGSLPGFVAEHADELRRADVCFWPWHTQRSDGTQVVFLRLKGLVTLKLRCRGGAWGGPRGAELHGAHSTWVANPAHRLAAALASMKNADDDVAIEGFYEGRKPPTPGDEELIHKLTKRFDAARVKSDLAIARFKQDAVEAALHAKCFQSEFNVAGCSALMPIATSIRKFGHANRAALQRSCSPISACRGSRPCPAMQTGSTRRTSTSRWPGIARRSSSPSAFYGGSLTRSVTDSRNGRPE